MNIDKFGWLKDCEHCASPYFDARPEGTEVSLLVIHNISLPPSEFGGPHIRALFTGTLDCPAGTPFESLQGLRVSTHFFINRAGHVIQFVSTHQRAWHAGVSIFEGRSACNDFSIGIELEGSDEIPYEPIQYAKLAAITRTLLQAYPAITRNRIVGHAQIAPGRKTDPGPAFDWKYYFELF